MCAEPAGGHGYALLGHGPDENPVKLLGQFGPGGSVERRPPPLAAIAGQRELADYKHRAANFADGQVHFPLRVVEDPQRDDLICQLPCVGLLVALDHPQQNQQPPVDLTADLSLHGDLGTADTLEASSHGSGQRAGSREHFGTLLSICGPRTSVFSSSLLPSPTLPPAPCSLLPLPCFPPLLFSIRHDSRRIRI